ncbi:hypothetical protein DL764_002023 [Monosporascus ibericus]|uniref:Peroxidase n=1 Tax=Monosporascus ibericus TaxID=155417 RepID=A0A4Q4TND6_9PEZI|nr:hypothetical protein DL764_002023 [Monosporascus ibericus]
MKLYVLTIGLLTTQTLAYPSMDRLLAEIQARDDVLLEGRSTTLIGDLLEAVSTPVGDAIKQILEGASAITDGATYKTPGALGSNACKKDTCCVWQYVADEMKNAFQDGNGCTDLARGAIRQGFHDAATWDKNSAYGGADGSLLLADELSRPDNRGLEPIGAQTLVWYNKYKQYGASMADLIQTAALAAVVSCPGGPRIRHFVGRKDDSRAGPTGKLPTPFQDAQSLIDLFTAKTFTASDLIALVGSHTASKQRFVDPARAETPQDSSPNVWNTKFYSETLSSDNKTILVFPSDRNLATYSSTKAQWNTFAGAGGDAVWKPAFAAAYFRMSMLGVNNLNDLAECTKVLPLPR